MNSRTLHVLLRGALLAGLLSTALAACGPGEMSPTVWGPEGAQPGTPGSQPGASGSTPGTSGGTDPGSGGSTPGATPAVPPVDIGSACNAAGGNTHAVVVAAGNLADIPNGMAALVTINRNGALADTQQRVGGIDMPQGIDLRADSKQAAISFGSSSSKGTRKHGVVFLSVNPDGSQLTLQQRLVLDGNFGPLRLAYTSPSSVVVSRVGPGQDNLLAITSQSGNFAAGQPFAVLNGYPQQVVPAPRDDEALYLESNADDRSGSLLHRISESGGAIASRGQPLTFEDGPMFLFMHPAFDVAYIPQMDRAANAAPYADPSPKGKLRVLAPDASGGWSVERSFPVPRYTSRMAAAPSGDFLILANAMSGGIYEIYMVKLEGTGRPTAATAPLASFKASMVFDLAVSPEGHIVASRQIKTGGGYDLISFARTGAERWQQCPQSIPFPGAPRLKIAR